MGIAHYRQPVLIYNPAAGKLRRDPEGLLQRTIAALRPGGIQPRLLPTSAAGQAGELARQAVDEGADLVLVLGGDGTVNEALQGLAHTPVPLGILPGGTANVLAMELGFGSRIEKAARALAAAKPTPIALGRVTAQDRASAQEMPPRYFLLMCGAGLDATVVYEVRAGLKNATGKIAYWVAGLSRIYRRVPPLAVRVNGSTGEYGFALISRVRNYGGDLEICRGASLRSHDFEVVLFEGEHPLRYAWYMLGVAVKRVRKMRGVRTERACCVDILTPTPVQVDGEFLGRHPVRIEIVPGALHLLMPEQYG